MARMLRQCYGNPGSPHFLGLSFFWAEQAEMARSRIPTGAEASGCFGYARRPIFPPTDRFTWNLTGGAGSWKAFLLRGPPVRFHVNWWEGKSPNTGANSKPG